MNTNSLPGNGNLSRATSDRFDRQFWKRLWRLARPYWNSPRRGWALLFLGALIALSLGAIGMQAVFSYVSRDIMNSLQKKDAAHFYHLMVLFAVWVVLFVPIAAYYPYLTGLLRIDWRDWMTELFVRRMLNRNALYYIMRDHSVDNPDQRISEDIDSFTNNSLNFSMTVLQSVVTAATFFGILWLISRWLAVCLLGYALRGTGMGTGLAGGFALINFNQQRFEADYRFALVHARDNAEAIALYDGARDEAAQLHRRFARVVSNFKLLILWQRHLALYTAAFDSAAGLVPYF